MHLHDHVFQVVNVNGRGLDGGDALFEGRDGADADFSRPRASSLRLSHTSSRLMAAGVMPWMRLAWPMVSGRCWLRRPCTSRDRPRTLV